jgi:hypothetical protein
LAFWGLAQKGRSSTLYSIIPFLEKKRYSTYSSRNKGFFVAIYNQKALEKERVPIDLNGKKSLSFTNHSKHPLTSPCAPKGKSLISLHPQLNSVVYKLYCQQHF